MTAIYKPNFHALLITALIAAGSLALLQFFPSVEWTRNRALVWALIGSGFLLGSILTQLLWRISSANRVVFHFIWPGLCAIFWVSMLVVAREAQYEADKAWVAVLKETRQGLRERQAREAAVALAEISKRERERLQDRFADYEGRVDALALAKVRDLDEAMQQEFQQNIDAYRRAQMDHPIRGPDDWIRASTRDELDRERQAYQHHRQQSQQLLEFLNGFPVRYEERIAELDLPPAAERIAKAELQRILLFWDYSQTRDVREWDVRFFELSLEAISLLRSQWGQWSWNPRESSFEFKSPDVEYEFFQLLDALQQILQQLDEVMERELAVEQPPEWQF